MLKAQDLGTYYRVKADNRDLNYKKYFSQGQKNITNGEYNSDNTKRLGVKRDERTFIRIT